jgi:CubicO group peptidase (beta-lactamase class C family)
MRRSLCLAVIIIALSGCAAAQQAELPTTQTMASVTLPAELDRVLRDYERAWGARDIAALVALFTDDGFVLQPGRPPVRGHAELAERYAGQGGGALRLRALAYATADRVGYIIGAYGYGDDPVDQGKFTLTLRRTAAGRWLIASDMDNGNVPAGRPATPPDGASAQQDPRPRDAGSPDIAAFVERLDSLRRAASIPGLSVAVVKDHAVVLALGLGFADAEHRIPATAETPYDIASVAKPLSAVVALRLVEDGALDLDRPMVDYSDWGNFCSEFSQQSSIFARDLRCQPSVHTLRHLLSHTATSTPGNHFSYNPVLYSWASRPIMAAADTSFSELVDRYVFTPAGMTRSARKHRALPVPEDLAQLLAPPHLIGPSGAIERAPALPPQGDGAAGGIITTVLDLARFDIALDQGVLISAASRDAMLAPVRSSNGEALAYGLGWFVQEYRGHTLVWHSGWWEDAYSALYLKVPALDLSFIVLANSEGVWWDNPLDKAEVQRSAFAQAFLRAFVED